MNEKLKAQYPKGTRVELLEMDDAYAPPIGTLGTVQYIDDMNTIHVNWDNGSTLGVVYEVGRIRKVNSMIIQAKKYWREILKECIIKTNTIPEKYYYLITWNKALQKHIDEEVLKEFVSDEENIDMLVSDVFYHGLDDGYITQSFDTNDLEDIIKKVYEVTYINDEYIEITRRAV